MSVGAGGDGGDDGDLLGTNRASGGDLQSSAAH
jgi:hypothetical protein